MLVVFTRLNSGVSVVQLNYITKGLSDSIIFLVIVDGQTAPEIVTSIYKYTESAKMTSFQGLIRE